jgi:hypothetical protein
MASSEAASETRSQAESEAESDDLGGFASIPGEPMSALFARIGIAPSKRPFDPYAPDVSFHPASNLNQHLLLREVMSNGLAHVLHKDKPMFYGQASDVGPLLHALAEAAGDRALHPDFSMVVSPNWTDPDNALLLIVNKRAFADNVIKEYVAFGFEEPPSEEEVDDIVHNMGTPTALEWLSPDLDAATFNHAAMGMALGMGIGNATSWATHQPLGRTMAMVREMQPALPSSGYALPPQSYYDVPRSGAIANHHFENTFSLNDEMQQAYQSATQFHPGLTFQGFAYAQAMNRLFVTPTPEQQ